MRKALFVLAFFGLVASALSVWVALRVEARHHELVAELEGHPHVRVLESRFERGFVRSRAETSIELRGPVGMLFQAPLTWAGRENVRPRVGLRLEQEIDHGPTSLWTWLQSGARGTPPVAHVRARVALDQEAFAEMAAAFGKFAPASLTLQVAADGRVAGHVALPATALQPRDVDPGKSPPWVGRLGAVHADLRLAPGSDMLQVSLRGGGLRLGGEALALDLGSWTGSIELPIGDSLRASRGEHVVEHLTIGWPGAEGADPTEIELAGIAWTRDGRPEQLLLAAGVDQARWNELEARDLRMELQAERDPDTADPATLPPHLPGVLGLRPQLELTALGGQTPHGPFHVSGRLDFAPPGGGDIHGDLELRLPGAWAEQLVDEDEALLSTWIDEGELRPDDDGGFRTHLRLGAAGSVAERLIALLPAPPVGAPEPEEAEPGEGETELAEDPSAEEGDAASVPAATADEGETATGASSGEALAEADAGETRSEPALPDAATPPVAPPAAAAP